MLNQFKKQYRDVQPHNEISQVFDNVYMVTGTNQFKLEETPISASRNMVIIRSEDNTLTLVNTVRLNDTQLEVLDKLGKVKHVIRIGAFHGYDDSFYIDRYKANYWLMPNMENEYKVDNAQELTNETMPIKDCTLFVYETTKQSEGALLLEQNGGVLITCDSIKNITKQDDLTNDACWQMYTKQGCIGTALIDDTWAGACKPQKQDFTKLQKLEFKHLITAHGKPLLDIASEEVSSSIKRRFN